MTNQDRQILTDNCEVLKEIVQCQLEQDQAWRFLAKALQEHFPNLQTEYQEARRKDSMFATVSTVAIGKLQERIDGIVERLKQPPAPQA